MRMRTIALTRGVDTHGERALVVLRGLTSVISGAMAICAVAHSYLEQRTDTDQKL